MPVSGFLRGVAALAVAGMVAWSAVAGAAAEAVTDVPPSIPAGLDLTVDSLEARVKKVEASEIDADAKADAIREYNAAIEQLRRSAEWQARTEALHRLQKNAPSILESLGREADKLAAQPPYQVPADATLTDLEIALSEAEAGLGVVRKTLTDVDSAQKLLAQRRLEVPTELAQSGAYDLIGDVDLPPPPTGSVEVLIARQVRHRADERAMSLQAEALGLELGTYELQREVLAARRDVYKRKLELRSGAVDAIQKATAERRTKDAQNALEEARGVEAELTRIHPVLGRLAAESANLAAERSGPEGLANRIQSNSEALAQVTRLVADIEERSRNVRQKAEAAGFSDAVGLLLRKERTELPDVDQMRSRIRARRSVISSAQFALLTLEDLREGLPAVEEEVDHILADQEKARGKLERVKLEASAREVLKTREDYLDDLIRDYNTYFGVLVDLDARERQLVEVTSSYKDFLDEHVLWIRSTAVPRWRSIVEAGHAAVWLFDPQHAVAPLHRVAAVAQAEPLAVSLVLVGWVLLFVYRRRLRRLHDRICESQGEGFRGPMVAAVAALGCAIVVSAVWPAAIWVLVWMIESAPSVMDDYSRALVAGLSFVASRIWGMETTRRFAGRKGVARRFLYWPEGALAQLRRLVTLFEILGLPALGIATLFFALGNEPWSDSLGRLAFLFGHAVFLWVLYRVMVPGSPVANVLLHRAGYDTPHGLVRRLHWIPLLLGGSNIALALLGYYFSAYEIFICVWRSLGLFVLLALVHAIAIRWIAGARRTLVQRQMADRRQQLAEGVDPEVEVEEEIDLSAIGTQTRQLVRVAIAAAAVFGLFGVWVNVIPALKALDHIDLWTVMTPVEQRTGSGDSVAVKMVDMPIPVTATNFVIAILALLLSVTASRNVPGFVEMTLLQRSRLDAGLRYAVTTMCRYTITVIGGITVFRNLGVAWAHVQWMVAGVSVGLGFGLQEIFSNLVSGLILLFERPVRVGDTVTLGGVSGTVTRIRMRATTILDFDRKELVVPNKEFVTAQLVNWSLSDPTVRLVVPVGVAYGSDTTVVETLLYEIAKGTAGVVAEPAPLVVMVRFGDSTLDFELRVFVVNPEAIVKTRHHLLLSIDAKFREAGVEIAFPQRDLHLRSVDASVVLPPAPSPLPS